MAKEPLKFSFRELVEAASKPYRDLWKSDGALNLGALSRRYSAKGHPLSEASLSRILRSGQRVGEKTINATFHALGIPKSLLRGEPMSADVEKLLTDYKLSTLLLAQRLESLPKDEYYALNEQIERILERERLLKEAMRSGNVTPIDRSKR